MATSARRPVHGQVGSVDPSAVQIPGQLELPGLDESPPVDLTEPELDRWYEQRDELLAVASEEC